MAVRDTVPDPKLMSPPDTAVNVPPLSTIALLERVTREAELLVSVPPPPKVSVLVNGVRLPEPPV